ncbi:HEAT repeat domain-containing protein, partial [bacterium]|nr:HEAT repeat domain-containing protein [bacterium]
AACVVRFKAAEALAKTGPPAAPHLCTALRDGNRDIRVAAARALQMMKEQAKEAVPALEKALRDRDYQVRLWAVGALAAIGPDASPALPAVTRLLRDKERSVRDAVVQALPKIDPEAAVSALIQATADRAVDVREAACIELGKLGDKATAAMHPMWKVLKDEEWQVRKAAAQAFLDIDPGPDESVSAVAQAYTNEKYPFMKEAYFNMIVKRGANDEAKPFVPRAVEELKEKTAALKTAMSKRQTGRVRRDWDQIVRFIGSVGPAADDAAAPAIRALLADKALDAEARKQLEALLAKIGGKQS